MRRVGEWLRRPMMLETCLILGAMLSLLMACWIESERKYFWADELFAWTLVTDGSYTHMLRALAGGADGAPPLYYSLARLWAYAFGASEISLRTLSSLGFGIALGLTWRVLAKEYGTRAALLGSLTMFCASPVLLTQNAEGRFYGLLMALSACALALYSKAARQRALSPRLYAATTLTHAGLVLCHVYGGLYSAALLVAMLAWDRRERAFRPAWCASVVLGWAAFIPWMRPFMRQARAFQPHSWIPVPDLGMLVRAYAFENPTLVWIGAMLLCVLAWKAKCAESDRTSVGLTLRVGNFSVLLAGAAFLTVPLVAFTISYVSSSIFLDRYFLPASLGAAILVSHLTAAILRSSPGAAGSRLAWATIYCGFLTLPLIRAAREQSPSLPGDGLALATAPLLPLVAEDSHDYLAGTHYALSTSRASVMRIAASRGESMDRLSHLGKLAFIVDVEVALDPRNTRRAINETRLLEQRRASFHDRAIMTTQELSRTWPAFMVLDDPAHLWYELRIQSNPAYESMVIAQKPGQRLIVVRRVSINTRQASAAGR